MAHTLLLFLLIFCVALAITLISYVFWENNTSSNKEANTNMKKPSLNQSVTEETTHNIENGVTTKIVTKTVYDSNNSVQITTREEEQICGNHVLSKKKSKISKSI